MDTFYVWNVLTTTPTHFLKSLQTYMEYSWMTAIFCFQYKCKCVHADNCYTETININVTENNVRVQFVNCLLLIINYHDRIVKQSKLTIVYSCM